MELVRQKNVATYIVVPLVDADGDPVTSAGSLDSNIDNWNDGANPNGFAACTNEATEIGATGAYYLSLTQAEMNFDYIIIYIASTGAKTQWVLIRTMVGDPLLLATTAATDAIKTDTAAILLDTDTMEADLKTYLDAIETNLEGDIEDNDTLIDTAITKIDAIKAETVLIVQDTGTTIPGTITTMQADLDNPNQYKADVSALATTAALNTHDGKLDTVDGIVDAILIDTDTMEADLKTEIDANETKIDTMQGNVTDILTDTGTTLDVLIKELGGLCNKHVYLDTTVFDGDGNMTSGRLRIYDSAANATTHGAGGLLYTLTITATYTSTNLTTYLATLA